MEQNYYTTEQNPMENKPKTKKGKLSTVIALIAAVAIVGGGAGFGGAFLASNLIKTSDGNKVISYDAPPEGENGDEKPVISRDEDVSSALTAISQSNSNGGTKKIFPSDVVPTGPNGTYTSEELYAAVNDTIVLVKLYVDANQGNYGSYDYYDYYFGYGEKPGSNKNDNDEPIYAGFGSGIVFTTDGYILTNAHVVSDAVKLEVIVNDYYDKDLTHTYEAKVIGSDESADIAVIKVDREEEFVAAQIGDSDTLSPGQEVCAIGNPGVTAEIMFDHTITKGVISGLDRACLSEGYELNLIQTDAAINSGNSGGGLFDMYGNVVGVVNSKIIATNYEGIGFALTINEAKPVMEDLLNYGYVKSRPVLGVTTVELNEYRAELYGAKLSKGLLIADMDESAPVSKSGLKISDIITKINGKNVSSVSDVQSIIGKLKVGDKITATVARTNERGGVDSIEIEIELTENKQTKQ